MDEREIVESFLKNGFQIKKEAIPLVSGNLKRIISGLNELKPRPFLVTKGHVKKLLKEIDASKPKIKLIKEYKPTKKPITVKDYVNKFLYRYEKMKEIISPRMSSRKLISINKITPKTKEFSMIGIVREKDERGLLIEDPTGEVRVRVGEGVKLEELYLDDVVGIRCESVKGEHMVKKIVYPDIPLNREVAKTKESLKILVLSNPKLKEGLIKLIEDTNPSSIFTFGSFDNDALTNFNVINVTEDSPPSLFQVEGVRILVLPNVFDDSKTSPNPFKSILRHREIISTFPSGVKDHFVLDDPPDVIISNVGDFNENYKGTTILSVSKSDKIISIDLKTREIRAFDYKKR